MKAIYEKRTMDFTFRDDRSGKTPLACSPHLHYHVEVVYMESGRTEAYIDSDLYTIESGDLLVVFPNKIHRFRDLTAGNKYKLFIVHPNLVPELCDEISVSSPRCPLIKADKVNERLISVINSIAQVDDYPVERKDMLLRGYLVSFFAEVMGSVEMDTNRSDENQAMKAIVLYCSQNFTKDLSLATLEEKLHLSKYYISHLFGDKLGIRLNDYINSLRISEACKLLRTTDNSITEIADAAGFGTLRTFNRAFVKHMGVSPSDFRKNSRGKPADVSIPSIDGLRISQAYAENTEVSRPEGCKEVVIGIQNYYIDDDCADVFCQSYFADDGCSQVCEAPDAHEN